MGPIWLAAALGGLILSSGFRNRINQEEGCAPARPVELAFGLVTLVLFMYEPEVCYVLVCTAAIFMLILPFRLRGWRLSRAVG